MKKTMTSEEEEIDLIISDDYVGSLKDKLVQNKEFQRKKHSSLNSMNLSMEVNLNQKWRLTSF